jgi:type I restriction enzyme, S subunit
MEEKKANTKKSISTLLKEGGFVLPTTEEEIIKFEERFGATEIILPEEVDSPNFIFENCPKSDSVKQSKLPKGKAKVILLDKPTNVDYYRRTVLAAEIVHELHKEMAFGHLKLQKLIYLAQRVENIDLPVNFLKQAMGPYDNQLMRSIDKQLKLKKWFEFHPTEKLKYKPLEKAGQHKNDFEKYYSQQKEKIYWLIETFRKTKSPTIEIIATLFACWEEIINENRVVTDDVLLERFYGWSEFKEKYSNEEILRQKEWMIENSLVPILK